MNSKVILIVGPSGVGKDTLIRYAKEQLKDDTNFNFVKRFITRQPDNNEMNYYVKDNAFEVLKQHKHFVSTWQAHGNKYAIAKECIEDKKANIISISRAHIKDFEDVFDNVKTVHITIPKDILEQRLLKRARESKEEIEKRINRTYEKIDAKNLIEFNNIESIDISSKKFVELLRSLNNE